MQDDSSTFRVKKRLCLIGMLVLAAIVGASGPWVTDDQDLERVFDIVTMIPALLMIVLWCNYDSHLHSYTIKKPLFLAIIFLAVLGVPIYLFSTRGLRGFLSIGLVAVFVGLCSLIMMVAYLLAEASIEYLQVANMRFLQSRSAIALLVLPRSHVLLHSLVD